MEIDTYIIRELRSRLYIHLARAFNTIVAKTPELRVQTCSRYKITRDLYILELKADSVNKIKTSYETNTNDKNCQIGGVAVERLLIETPVTF